MTNEYKEFLTHFPTVSEELTQYAINTVFLDSRYLFVWRVGKVQMTYCTHCKVEYPLGNGQASFKHNEKTTCLNCGSECVVKSNGCGRSKLIDSAYVVWYEKSLIDPNAIVATWLYVWRDYRGDYRKVETQFSSMALYLFVPGQGGKMFKPSGYALKWQEMRTVHPVSQGMNYWSHKEVFCSWDSVEHAVAGTPFQYSTWQQYGDQTYVLVDFFDLAAKYPCVEYLTKLGLKSVVTAKLKGQRTYGVVNWRGKSIDKVLRLERSEIRQLLAIAISVTPISLHSYHFWRKRGWMISLVDAHDLRNLTDDYYRRIVNQSKEFGSEIEVSKYILKQMRRSDAPSNFSSATHVLTQWRDYIRNCKELGMDTTQHHVIFPTNLHQAHDKAMSKIKVKNDAALNQLIQERLKYLEVFSFTDGNYLIRPAVSSIELFDEGKALNHCVGGYSDRYAAGETDLYVLRDSSKPESPLCTIEVVRGEIRQARGRDNKLPTPEVQAFLKQFEQNIRLVGKRKKPKRAKNLQKIAV